MSTTARLSPWRVLLAVVILLATAVAGVVGVRMYEAGASQESAPRWFAGYVDVTATPSYAFEEGSPDAEGNTSDVVLSFIVADKDGTCTPSWGTYYGLDEAGQELDLDRRVERLREQGAGVVVSFGGAINDELATVCDSPEELADAYRQVIERYDLDTIDLDIEGPALTDSKSNALRAEAVASLQAERRAEGKPLAVWLTLPVIPSGLTAEGRDVVSGMLDSGTDLAGVNLMTMNYGEARESRTMFDASAAAMRSTHRQLGILYDQAGIPLSDSALWGKLGATPMIGQNDVPGEVFDLDDAERFHDFAVENGVGRMSTWSLNRDATCGSNYPDVTRVSDACSGVEQGDTRFAEVLSKGYTGHAAEAADASTEPDPTAAAPAEDDPETSPYPIWNKEASYLEGTKIVWHRNVYEAKWWTRGELPDNPVLEEWDTPWELIGPVLPGETPAPVFTVEKGTYPEWKGNASYDKGDRVLSEGTPYEAKWWTEGDSPDASVADPDSSPWVPLTAEEVKADAAEES
ncbi:chitinase [Nesterenkonia halotolerans]|uniref:Chitinase n=1 Tax=Nesterenkonia halotolerans TaxID=225325 RepID=A0ABR9J5A2_9MICC|nr:carbohydrate-binding protein [Nesterenkonia halotolerans]MBE1514160.1 chitinase [Nesterenkonia halotolerans]